MVTATKLARMDTKVKGFLAKELAKEPNYQSHVARLWDRYRDLGLPNDDFVAELTSGKKPSRFQRVWEMMIARHLDAQGHKLTCPGRGPDFRFEHAGVTVWVEAIAPEPRGLHDEWMGGQSRNGSVPDDEVLLRWTAAFKEKWEKLQEYRDKHIVRPCDAYVIAISGVQLGYIPMDHGISQQPLAIETVFPIGPLKVFLNSQTSRIEGSRVSQRFFILNTNNSPVWTTAFVDPTYAGVSAILGCSVDRSYDAELPAFVAHNPFAEVGIAPGVLGVSIEEWFAQPTSTPGEFELIKRAGLVK